MRLRSGGMDSGRGDSVNCSTGDSDIACRYDRARPG